MIVRIDNIILWKKALFLAPLQASASKEMKDYSQFLILIGELVLFS